MPPTPIPIPSARPRPGRAPLVLAGLVAGVLAALAAPSRAEDQGVTRSQVTGWPRSSDTPPASIAQPPAGHGDENDDDGTEYDTNWVLDADAGDDDVVWLRVQKANVLGFGRAVDADASSGTTKRGSAWGEDRLAFSVAGSEDRPGTIVVTNDIRVDAAWIVEGTGINHAVMYGEALDVNGTVHRFSRVRAADARLASTETDGTTTTDQTWDSASSGGGEEGGESESSGDRSTTREVDSIERRAESAETDAGESDASWTAERRFRARECTVRIASAETIEVKAQAAFDGVETASEVTRFDTINIVEARYVLDAAPDGGAGTPGGEDPPGPTTPGGGDGSSPGTPDGTKPAPEPGESEPPLPAPVTPVEPAEPWDPEGPAGLGGCELPGIDPTAGDPAGGEPAGETDLGGSSPSPEGGAAPEPDPTAEGPNLGGG